MDFVNVFSFSWVRTVSPVIRFPQRSVLQVVGPGHGKAPTQDAIVTTRISIFFVGEHQTKLNLHFAAVDGWGGRSN